MPLVQKNGVSVVVPLDPDSPTYLEQICDLALGPTFYHPLPTAITRPAIMKLFEELEKRESIEKTVILPIGTGRPAGCFRDPATEGPEMDKYEALGIPRPAPKGCLKPAGGKGKGKGKGKQSAKLVSFNDAALATCLETGARVEPRGSSESAKRRFEATHQRLKARKGRGMLTDGPAHNELPPSPLGAKASHPRTAVLRARLDEAWSNANALSERAIKRGYMDFAYYVCKWGSKQHRNLAAVQAKFESVRFGSFEGPEREHAIDGGEELVSLSRWYRDIATAMSEPRTRTRYTVEE